MLRSPVRVPAHAIDAEQPFRAAFEQAADGMALVGLDGRWLRVNPALCALTGYAEPELLATSFQELTHPDDRAADRDRIRQFLAAEITACHMEKRYRRRDGEAVWVRVGVSLARDEDGAPLHFVTHVVEIGAQKQMEAVLRVTERRFRAMFHEAPTMLALLTDRDGEPLIADCNAQFATTLGYRREELLGRPVTELYTQGSKTAFATDRSYQRAITGAAVVTERELIGRDGRVIQTLVQVQPDSERIGALNGLMTMYIDITERKQAEAALRAGEARLRAVMSSAPVVLFAIDRDGVFTTSSGRGLTAMGRAEGEVVGRSYREIYAARPEIIALIERAFAGEEVTESLDLVRAVFEVRIVPWQDADGRDAGIVGVATDVTARVRAEQELEHALHRLEERTLALETKTREQEAFLYTVSHDLRAPLVSIQGLAGILAEDHAAELPEAARGYLTRIGVNADRMNGLISDLLDLARVGRLDVECGPVDLAGEVAEVIAQLGPTLARRGARVVGADALPTVWANQARMGQLFLNLIDNAVAYTPPDRAPRVALGARETAEGWEIEVRDNGAGIPAEWQEKVFGLFQRLPAGKRLNPNGTGIGLAIVAKIVETHGGRLRIESTEGTGTSFFVSLPRPAPGDDGGPTSRNRGDLAPARASANDR